MNEPNDSASNESEQARQEDRYKHKSLYKSGCSLLIVGFIGVFSIMLARDLSPETQWIILVSSFSTMWVGYLVVNVGWFLDGAWGIAIGVFAAFPLTIMIGAGLLLKETHGISNIELFGAIGAVAGVFAAVVLAFSEHKLFGLVVLLGSLFAIAKYGAAIFS